MSSKLYTNKRQLKTLIRKYKKLCDNKEKEQAKNKQLDEAIRMMVIWNAKQTAISSLCDEILKRSGRNALNKELKQFAERIKHNI